ncbi:MAG TPA: TetR family transcriptional regulator [Rubrivivax sp.]|nr:TetR family transcriptional regulator [Rubrivivax sp.]
MVRRTKEEAQQTRNALLDAAEAVFERRGVSGTSLQEVAEAAGVTRGAVYWHFRGKADLYNAMMDRAVLPFEARWLMPGADDAADPMARLRALLLDILHRVATDPRLQRVVAISTLKVEYVGEFDAVRERHLHVRTQAAQRIEQLLRQAAAAGQLAPAVAPKAAARALHALVDGLIRHWMLDRNAFELQHAGRAAMLQVLDGLRKS